jgi:hypothetical protein
MESNTNLFEEATEVSMARAALAKQYNVESSELEYLGFTPIGDLDGFNESDKLFQFVLFHEGHEKNGSTVAIPSN